MYKALSHGVQPVAVKVFPLTANAEQHAEFQREVVLLKSCRDGNIVQVTCVTVCCSFLCLRWRWCLKMTQELQLHAEWTVDSVDNIMSVCQRINLRICTQMTSCPVPACAYDVRAARCSSWVPARRTSRR